MFAPDWQVDVTPIKCIWAVWLKTLCHLFFGVKIFHAHELFCSFSRLRRQNNPRLSPLTIASNFVLLAVDGKDM